MVFDLSGSSKQYLLVERNICETLARQAPDLTVSSCTDQKSIPNNHQSDARPRSALISFLCRARSESFRFITRDFLECFFYAFFNLKKKSSFFMTTLHHPLSQIVACGCFWIRKNVSGVCFPFPFRFEKNSSINKK